MLKKYWIVKILIRLTFQPDSYEIERFEYDCEPMEEDIEKHLQHLRHWEEREGYPGTIFAEVVKAYKFV